MKWKKGEKTNDFETSLHLLSYRSLHFIQPSNTMYVLHVLPSIRFCRFMFFSVLFDVPLHIDSFTSTRI